VGPGSTSVTLPAYHVWRFTAGEAGDFPTLAARLQRVSPRPPSDEPRSDTLRWRTLPLSPFAERSPHRRNRRPHPQDVADDVAVLTAPPVDPLRPVITVPVYGDAWVADPAATTWGAVSSETRGTAASGAWGCGRGSKSRSCWPMPRRPRRVRFDAAAQRIRHLTAGLAAARSLWSRRLPADPLRRPGHLRPDASEDDDRRGKHPGSRHGGRRPLASALFSTAARRVYGRGRHDRPWQRTGADPAALIDQANVCPPPPARSPNGLPNTDDLAKATGTDPLDQSIEKGVSKGRITADKLRVCGKKFDLSQYPPDLAAELKQVIEMWLTAGAGGGAPLMALLAILDSSTGSSPARGAEEAACGPGSRTRHRRPARSGKGAPHRATRSTVPVH